MYVQLFVQINYGNVALKIISLAFNYPIDSLHVYKTACGTGPLDTAICFTTIVTITFYIYVKTMYLAIAYCIDNLAIINSFLLIVLTTIPSVLVDYER